MRITSKFWAIASEEISSFFKGNDQVHCKSLLSWAHDGSHWAHDDLYVAVDDSMVETYLRIFREVFRETGHFEHYKMMMGDDFTDDDHVNKPAEIPVPN
ncbi:MAG: AAA family ATPase [Acidobacteria bacterium]|nr:AAA family ATPase [Acidobacteriota bacterium]